MLQNVYILLPTSRIDKNVENTSLSTYLNAVHGINMSNCTGRQRISSDGGARKQRTDGFDQKVSQVTDRGPGGVRSLPLDPWPLMHIFSDFYEEPVEFNVRILVLNAALKMKRKKTLTENQGHQRGLQQPPSRRHESTRGHYRQSTLTFNLEYYSKIVPRKQPASYAIMRFMIARAFQRPS